MTTKVMRQPKALATVMPPTNSDSAAPRRSAGTSWLTATLATPKNTPWPQADTSRAPSSSS